MIDLTPERALIFRLTHVRNLPWILANGLQCRNSATRDPEFIQIGSAELITRRGHRKVPVEPGGTLDDYVPFYFTPRSPMMLNVATGRNGVTRRPLRELVVLTSSLHTVQEQGRRFVFTDRHAYLEAAEFFSDIAELTRLDWLRLRAADFRRDPNDLAKFERYQAEALIHQHLPVGALRAIVCHGPTEDAYVRYLVQNHGTGTRVLSRPRWFVA